jgi:hypothetical protein
MHAGAEDLGDLVGAQPPQAEFAAAFEQLVDREVALEDEVAAIGMASRLRSASARIRGRQEARRSIWCAR